MFCRESPATCLFTLSGVAGHSSKQTAAAQECLVVPKTPPFTFLQILILHGDAWCHSFLILDVRLVPSFQNPVSDVCQSFWEVIRHAWNSS